MKGRKIIGILLLCIGVGLCAYPMIKQAYSSYRQAQLKEAFKELLDHNKAVKVPLSEEITPEEEFTPETNTVSGSGVTASEGNITPTIVISEKLSNRDPFPQLNPPEYIDLEENDVVADSQTADNIKDRLKGQTVIGLIEIEKIDLIYAIVEGTSKANLGVAIGHMNKTAGIGQTGNCVLAGHHGGTSGPYFKNINQLKTGDKIKLTDIYGNEYTYEVTDSFTVKPTEMSVTEEISKQKILTLITCQDSGTKRFIVRAVCK